MISSMTYYSSIKSGFKSVISDRKTRNAVSPGEFVFCKNNPHHPSNTCLFVKKEKKKPQHPKSEHSKPELTDIIVKFYCTKNEKQIKKPRNHSFHYRNQCKDPSCPWMKCESHYNKSSAEYVFSQLYAHGTEQQVLSMSNGAQNSMLWAQLAFTSPQELPPGPLHPRKVLMICSWLVTEKWLYSPLTAVSTAATKGSCWV